MENLSLLSAGTGSGLDDTFTVPPLSVPINETIVVNATKKKRSPNVVYTPDDIVYTNSHDAVEHVKAEETWGKLRTVRTIEGLKINYRSNKVS